MAKIVIFSKTHSDKRLIRYIGSGHTPLYDSRDDVIINPLTWDLIGHTPFRYLRANAGETDIREMTVTQKMNVDQEIADAKAQAEELAKDISNMTKLDRALWLVQLDEVNRVRNWLGKPTITLNAFKQKVKDKYDTLG